MLLNLKNTQLKSRAVKICDERYTFNKIWGVFFICPKGSQMLIGPNFPWNTRIQCLLQIFNTWIKFFDTGVKFWEKRVILSSFIKNRATLWFRFFSGVTLCCAVTHRSIRCMIIFFQWLHFILKIGCNYHHLTKYLCFQGSQYRTQHWTVHSQS